MKLKYLFFNIFTFSFLICGTVYSNTYTCKNWNKVQWELFRLKVLKHIKAGNKNTLLKLTDMVLPECDEIMSWNYLTCFTKIKGFLDILKNNQSGKNRYYSPIMSNEEYRKRLPDLAKKLPGPFKNGVPRNWESILKRKGWKWARFVSRIDESAEGNEDRVNKRLVIKIPGTDLGDEYKNYEVLLMAMNDSENFEESRRFAMIVTDKGKSPPTPYFNEWKKPLGKKKFEEYHSTANCMECHPNGPRKIDPLHGIVDEKENDLPITASNSTLNDFNQSIDHKISDYSNMTHKGIFDGIEVGAKQGCTNCHGEGKLRGPLLPGQSGDPMNPIKGVHDAVVSAGSMPPDGKRRERTEKNELYQSIVDDYREQLAEGLDTGKCEFSLLGPRGDDSVADDPRSTLPEIDFVLPERNEREEREVFFH